MTAVAPVVVAVVLLLLFGGLAAVFALLLRAGSRAAQAQVRDLQTFAAARGLTYRARDDALVARFPGDPFGRGSGRVALHVLEGSYGGRPVVLFEYRFATGGGRNRHRHVVRVVATALPAPVPRLELVPSSTFGTFVDGFRGGDHQLGDPAFDAAYRIFTDSPDFAADVLDVPLRQWLFPQRPPYFRLSGGDLVVVEVGGLDGTRADRMLAFADALLDRVPARVWDRAGRPLS